MKRIITTLGVFALGAGAATAGGIDRSGQNIGILFEKGRYAEFSLGYSRPDLSGTDDPLGPFPGGGNSSNVSDSFTQLGLAFKADVNEQLSYALIIDQPFGADIAYGAGSFNLGGTVADAEAHAVTTLLRWKFNENFSVHGGLRAQRAKGNIGLRGAAYWNPEAPGAGSGFDGYDVNLKSDWAAGYVLGAAYEIPEIALRVALTYQSEIEHKFDTTESFGAGAIVLPESVTRVKTPRSVNLDFQTGIMADTLLFGQVRWAKWSEFLVDPLIFTPQNGGEGLIGLDNTITYTLGVGRKFNETWAGSAAITYERKDSHLISPLAPVNGRIGLTLAAIYTQDNMKITTGVNYTKLGRASPETGTPDQARADFRDNDALSVGVRVGFAF